MNAVELFAGAGGLGMGVSRAGFKQILSIEKDSKCCYTVDQNIERVSELFGWNLVSSDINKYDFTFLADKVELVTGGPPCQPFSVGGKHKAFNDKRDMFPEAIRAIREIRPKAFLLENVKGITREKFSNYFEYIRLQLSYPEVIKKENEDWPSHFQRLEDHHTGSIHHGLSYSVISRVLNSADYGVPQKRERVFIVGFRNDLHCNWHFPNGNYSLDALLWDKKFGKYWDKFKIPLHEQVIAPQQDILAKKIIEKPMTKPWVTVREALSDLPCPKDDIEDSSKLLNHVFKDGARSYIGHTGSSLDDPSKTLKAGNHGVPGGENMLRKHDGSVRYFTTRECARLQTFPDEYEFFCSWGESIRQIGNAVPVTLAKIIAESIAVALAR